MPIVSNAKCKEMFLEGGRREHIPDIFLCAGYEKGGIDSCQVSTICLRGKPFSVSVVTLNSFNNGALLALQWVVVLIFA